MLEHAGERSARSGGVVSAGHPEVTEVGAAILRRGGNAVDAVVGAMFAAFVAEPLLCSPGGAGFMLVHRDGEARAYDFFSTAPGLGTGSAPYTPPEGAFLAVEVDFGAAKQTFHIGPGSISVPGAVKGLCEAQSEGGRLTLPEVLEPAYALGMKGAVVTDLGAFVPQLLEPIIRSRPEFERYFVGPEGRLIEEGARFRNADLAAFYNELASARSGEILYTGPRAEALLREVRSGGGGLTAQDLSTYVVRRGAPVAYAGNGSTTLFMTPAPSSGGMLIAYGLALLESGPPRVPGSEEEVLMLRAAMAETARARSEVIGAHTPTDAHAERLLDGAYVEAGRARVKHLLALGPRALPESAERGNEMGSTTHISVIDATGNAAAVTISSGECSGVVVPGCGIFLNNFLGEEDLNPLGFHQFSPGVRLGSTMCPVLMRGADGTIAAMGSGGSNRIRTALLQVLRNLVTHHQHPAEAVRSDRLHYEAGVLYAEGANVHARAMQALAGLGLPHSLFPAPSMYFGGVHLARRSGSGEVIGVGDARRSGAVSLEHMP